MSCYQVPDRHISAIIGYACRAGLNAGWTSPEGYIYMPGKEQETFDLLYEANARSVNARYGGDYPLSGGMYTADAPHLRPIEVIKAIDGLRYQCDEWEGFDGSDADKVLLAVQRYAVCQLPGYAAAKWELT